METEFAFFDDTFRLYQEDEKRLPQNDVETTVQSSQTEFSEDPTDPNFDPSVFTD